MYKDIVGLLGYAALFAVACVTGHAVPAFLIGVAFFFGLWLGSVDRSQSAPEYDLPEYPSHALELEKTADSLFGDEHYSEALSAYAAAVKFAFDQGADPSVICELIIKRNIAEQAVVHGTYSGDVPRDSLKILDTLLTNSVAIDESELPALKQAMPAIRELAGLYSLKAVKSGEKYRRLCQRMTEIESK